MSNQFDRNSMLYVVEFVNGSSSAYRTLMDAGYNNNTVRTARVGSLTSIRIIFKSADAEKIY